VNTSTDSRTKLNDAKIQLDLALQNIKDPTLFKSFINNFIVNARSVTFVMQKEYSKHARFSTWYNSQQESMRVKPICKFFLEQRNVILKERSITPGSRSVPITSIQSDGAIHPQTGAYVQTWEFEAYSDYVPGDNGNVGRTCKEYYGILENLLAEWERIVKA
jgi:hypothetical protein